jgi:type I restriction enzyme, S subunit
VSWHVVSLSDVLKVEGGFAFKSKDFEDIGCPIIRISNVDGSSVNVNNAARIPAEKIGKGEKYKLESGDILIAMSGATTGKLGVVPDLNNRSVYLNQRVGRFNFKSESIDRNYLWFFLNSDVCQNRIKILAEGAAQPNISGGQIESIEIPLPPLSTQKQIAAILEKADQLRKDCQQMEQELNNLAQAVFIDMFGDPVSNPKGWDFLPLRDIISGDLQNGAYYPKEAYSSAGVEMVHMSDVFYDFVPRGQMKRVKASPKDIEKYKLTSNDLLISRRSLMLEGAAKPSLIQNSEEDLIFESSMIRLTPNSEKITVKYLFYYLSNPLVKSNYIFQYVTGATIKGINQANLEKVSIMVPDLNAQKKFDLIEEKIRSEKERLRDLASQYSDNFNSLMQKAFNGELNLKNKAA